MLPQMMPLPWSLIFIFMFISFFSIFIYMNFFSIFQPSLFIKKNFLKIKEVKMPW